MCECKSLILLTVTEAIGDLPVGQIFNCTFFDKQAVARDHCPLSGNISI
ncbi:hypothetical protein FBZ88_11713 [Nitrospirillum bahiense]|uniref:Uncharacterized protein n=1 Tax=Nitrospirillum amazonense TaxID=28077 RepID=A0A560FJ78_9PROT|nr:hypothetical protein FBZ88_11713 [Nitrospirillum amazonense]